MPRATDATPQMQKQINQPPVPRQPRLRRKKRRAEEKRADTGEARSAALNGVAEPHASRIAEIQWQRTCHPLVISTAVQTTKLQRMARGKSPQTIGSSNITSWRQIREHAHRSPTPYNASSDLRGTWQLISRRSGGNGASRYASSAESAGDA